MSDSNHPEATAIDSETIQTSLGPTLVHHGSLWSLDLTALKIFRGLSVLSRELGEKIIDQARSSLIDINVEHIIRPRVNPELLHHLGITLVKVAAEHETMAALGRNPELFQDHFRTLFGTLQRDRYRNVLFPAANGHHIKALVFKFAFPPFEEEGAGSSEFIFLLERMPLPKSGDRCSLRIIIEDSLRPRLALEHIPHVVVEDTESRTFIAGSTRIAETWAEGLRREAERNRRAFFEKRKPYSHLFNQFRKAGLDTIEEVNLNWSDSFVSRIIESEPAELTSLLKRVLLALEDRIIRRILENQEVVRIICDDVYLYLDLSQLGRVLNLSLGRPRKRIDLDAFLERMPTTLNIVESTPPKLLAETRVILIHHITAEVLGLIAALRRLGCRDLTTLFVAYAGEAPSSYLGPILDLPPEEFRCLALVNIPDEKSVEGHFKLSTQYSALAYENELAAMLGKRRMRFYEAMQAVARFELMRQVDRAERWGGRCLIIEDGGYLAPALNRACRKGNTVAEFLGIENKSAPDERQLQDVLKPLLIGSVEHTRDGMNRIEAVVSEYGGLSFPAFTIAVSHRKIHVEAREVAMTILNAVENMLNATGRILSRRRCLVIGSHGAIGSHLMRCLRERLVAPTEQMAGIDLKVSKESARANFPAIECRTFAELPESVRRGFDLVLGVTGQSVLKGEDLEQWLLRGEPRELVLVSGSTKTEEFVDLATYIGDMLNQAEPLVGGMQVSITVLDVTDPITNRLYGHRYRFTFEGPNGQRQRDVIFIAKLTPVNFMFYGVPTEVIDEVLGELLSTSAGLVKRARSEKVPCTLQAVDRDITPLGEPIKF